MTWFVRLSKLVIVAGVLAVLALAAGADWWDTGGTFAASPSAAPQAQSHHQR